MMVVEDEPTGVSPVLMTDGISLAGCKENGLLSVSPLVSVRDLGMQLFFNFFFYFLSYTHTTLTRCTGENWFCVNQCHSNM